jgi:hypothetical protein
MRCGLHPYIYGFSQFIRNAELGHVRRVVLCTFGMCFWRVSAAFREPDVLAHGPRELPAPERDWRNIAPRKPLASNKRQLVHSYQARPAVLLPSFA